MLRTVLATKTVKNEAKDEKNVWPQQNGTTVNMASKNKIFLRRMLPDYLIP
jgi:hypothetical protein